MRDQLMTMYGIQCNHPPNPSHLPDYISICSLRSPRATFHAPAQRVSLPAAACDGPTSGRAHAAFVGV